MKTQYLSGNKHFKHVLVCCGYNAFNKDNLVESASYCVDIVLIITVLTLKLKNPDPINQLLTQ